MTRQRSRFPHRQRAGWAFLAVLALVAGACGDDDDDTAVGDTAAGSTERDTGPTGDDTAAFCQARIDLERAFGSEQPDVDAVMSLLEAMEASALLSRSPRTGGGWCGGNRAYGPTETREKYSFAGSVAVLWVKKGRKSSPSVPNPT